MTSSSAGVGTEIFGLKLLLSNWVKVKLKEQKDSAVQLLETVMADGLLVILFKLITIDKPLLMLNKTLPVVKFVVNNLMQNHELLKLLEVMTLVQRHQFLLVHLLMLLLMVLVLLMMLLNHEL